MTDLYVNCNVREYLAPPSVEANWVFPFLKWYVKLLKSCNEEEFEEVIRCIRFDYETFKGGCGMTEERLINIINTVYETEGFKGVIEEVQSRLVYGTVRKTNGLYCISTGGWSDDEALLDALISPMTKFHYHYVGYLVGGHFYFSEDKSFECYQRVKIILGDFE